MCRPSHAVAVVTRSPFACKLRPNGYFPRVFLLSFHTSSSLRVRSPLPLPQSGIDISEELLALFEDVKLRHKHKYFVFSLKPTGKVRRAAAAAAQRARRRFAQAVFAAAR